MTDSTIRHRMGGAEWGMLIALSLLWGGSYFFIGVAVHDLPPLTIVTLRVALAAIILIIVIKAMGQAIRLDGAIVAAFLGMGLLNNVIPFTLIVWGQTHIASGLASILNATTPLSTVVVAHVLTQDEKMTRTRLAGVLIGFAGVVVLIGPEMLMGVGANVVAELACVSAGISYAFAGVFGRRFRRMGVPPLVTAAGQVTASALMLMPIALWVDTPWRLPPPGLATWEAILGMAALSTALAYAIYFRLLATVGATNLLLVTFLIPVSAIFLGVTLLGEQFKPEHFLGLALIGAGLAAIDGRFVPAFRIFEKRDARWRNKP